VTVDPVAEAIVDIMSPCSSPAPQPPRKRPIAPTTPARIEGIRLVGVFFESGIVKRIEQRRFTKIFRQSGVVKLLLIIAFLQMLCG
jgi:hypothetical protein